MSFNEGMDQLSQLCKGHDWFFDIGTDTSNRYVVYVHRMSLDILKFVPDMIGKRQVLVHFVGSLCLNKDKFVSKPEDPPPLDVVSEVVGSVEEEKSLLHLTKELDRLERQCGSNILQDIFYEVHDGSNAVTNLSAKFPDVRKSLEKLYQQYGFDVIYEEMDG